MDNTDKENVCCPELVVVECVDTTKHCHLVCDFSKALLSNSTIRTKCIGDFSQCILHNQ